MGRKYVASALHSQRVSIPNFNARFRRLAMTLFGRNDRCAKQQGRFVITQFAKCLRTMRPEVNSAKNEIRNSFPLITVTCPLRYPAAPRKYRIMAQSVRRSGNKRTIPCREPSAPSSTRYPWARWGRSRHQSSDAFRRYNDNLM